MSILPIGAADRTLSLYDTNPKAQPQMLVTIDTEEEFDWNAPFSRDARTVENIKHQHLAQDIFNQHGVIPTYVIDQAVLEDDYSVDYFKSLKADGRAEIGVHLHPWLTKPYSEDVCNKNSFHGNLPLDLEKAKIDHITGTFTRTMGFSPQIFKAGRYGLGPNSYTLLRSAGYTIDLSPVANTSFSQNDGPDFAGFPDRPFWVDTSGGMISVPLTKGFAGALSPLFGAGKMLHGGLFDAQWFRASKMPAILSRLRLCDRIPLTPEGVESADQIKLLKELTRRKQFGGVYSLAYHSSTLMVGGSPYAGSVGDVQLCLDRITEVITAFKDDIGGEFTTPSGLYAQFLKGTKV